MCSDLIEHQRTGMSFLYYCSLNRLPGLFFMRGYRDAKDDTETMNRVPNETKVRSCFLILTLIFFIVLIYEAAVCKMFCVN